MASMNITFSGDRNQGPQVGSNSGHIHFYSYGPHGSEESPIKPEPSSTVPFRRDPDFVDRDILAKVDKICSKPAARAALVGLGGMGKSQLAIEYSYRIREAFPQTWIFWVHASNAARFEEGYRIIADRIKLPRKDEPTADILQLGKYEAAEVMNRRVLDGKEKVLRKEHPNTLTSVNHLASVLSCQGKYEAAEEMNRRALEGSERAHGKEHHITLTSVNNLATVLQIQGKYEVAEEMNRRVLDGKEKALGKEHPDTLTSVNNLASAAATTLP